MKQVIQFLRTKQNKKMKLQRTVHLEEVKLSTRMLKQQEVKKSCSKQEVNSLLEVRERKTGRRELGRNHTTIRARMRIEENNPSSLDNIRDARLKKQEEKNKQNPFV